MADPANALPDKVMGPVDNMLFDEHVFESVTFHGALFRNCTFNAVAFHNCTFRTVRFENCRIQQPRFEKSTVEHIALIDTAVISGPGPRKVDTVGVKLLALL
ncbi:pentapeptide repeat-containing protein [Corynebacterium sp. CCUG 69979]|uniref:pentapeptide repeat-containing protein n=1 Tax=Corynebacterium sp. CCUG 69979 TaxID=2823890 RepID=UPI002109A746|nr:pentapeptide repeat-containing protein [Corynebacterium sp. CCUG 69979]MCQ4625941.1 pentapeptide repeat-containing protein [Corynebacterium sp. CCUG 69979]